MASDCYCLSFTFECGDESTFDIDLNIAGTFNGYPYYIGVYTTYEFELFWSGTQWIFRETDPLFPDPILSSNQSSLKPCIISNPNWIFNATANFESFCKIQPISFSTISEPLLCPTPTPTPTPTNTPTPTPTPAPPPSPSPLPQFINECEPITIFDMGISCVVVQPSTAKSNDGAASLLITGGTPPYRIIWENGNESPAIGNLSVGSYPATVVDFYGDFTANTVCILTGQTIQPTPTPTPTPTSIPTGPQFCMNIKAQLYGPTREFIGLSLLETFTVDSYVNGQLSWISNSGNYRIYWRPSPPNPPPSCWILSASTTPFTFISNNTPSSPPTNSNDWQILGAVPGTVNITITEGPCGGLFELSPFSIANPNIELFAYKNDTVCGCDGSIILNANGGNTPYQYSIDNGVTYGTFPIFDNVCSGSYTVVVKDASGYTQLSQILINNPNPPKTYLVNLTKTSQTIIDDGINLTKTFQSKLFVDPPLPNGVTITFDLIHTNNFNSSINENSAEISTNSVLEKNEVSIPYSFDSVVTGTSVNPLNGCQDKFIYNTGTTQTWQGLTYTLNDEIIINTTTTLTKNFTSGCDIGNSEENYYVSNLQISGCNCCEVQNLTL